MMREARPLSSPSRSGAKAARCSGGLRPPSLLGSAVTDRRYSVSASNLPSPQEHSRW